MNPQEITLIIWDELANFSLKETQRQLGNNSLYKNVKRYSSVDEFNSIIKSLDISEKLVFVCHVNFNDFSGYFDYRNSGLISNYPLLNTTYVSSGDSGTVMHSLFTKYSRSEKIVLYSQLLNQIKSDEIPPVSKSALVDQHSSADTRINLLKKGIFLSHSSFDKAVVEKFKDLVLNLGLEVKNENIKFTSSELEGIPAGVNIPDDLREFINGEMGLFIQFISEDYVKSRTCINEEGAAWCILEDKMFVPIFLGKHARAFTKELNKSIVIDNKESLLNIYQHRKDFFGEQNVTALNQKIDHFIEFLNDRE